MTGYTTPLLLVPGDQIHVGPLFGGAWRTVEEIRPCFIPAHAPLCTVLEAEGWRNLPGTHHGPDAYVWARPGLAVTG